MSFNSSFSSISGRMKYVTCQQSDFRKSWFSLPSACSTSKRPRSKGRHQMRQSHRGWTKWLCLWYLHTLTDRRSYASSPEAGPPADVTTGTVNVDARERSVWTRSKASSLQALANPDHDDHRTEPCLNKSESWSKLSVHMISVLGPNFPRERTQKQPEMSQNLWNTIFSAMVRLVDDRTYERFNQRSVSQHTKEFTRSGARNSFFWLATTWKGNERLRSTNIKSIDNVKEMSIKYPSSSSIMELSAKMGTCRIKADVQKAPVDTKRETEGLANDITEERIELDVRRRKILASSLSVRRGGVDEGGHVDINVIFREKGAVILLSMFERSHMRLLWTWKIFLSAKIYWLWYDSWFVGWRSMSIVIWRSGRLLEVCCGRMGLQRVLQQRHWIPSETSFETMDTST